MKETFKSLISQLKSASVLLEKTGDFRSSLGDCEKRAQTGSVPAKLGGLAGLIKGSTVVHGMWSVLPYNAARCWCQRNDL